MLIYGLSEAARRLGVALVGAWVLACPARSSGGKAASEIPILDVSLFRHNTIFAFSNLAALINYSATFAVDLPAESLPAVHEGLQPVVAGLLLVTPPAVMTLFSPFAGRLSDRIEPVVVASIGMAVTTLGLFFFIFLGDDTSLALIILNLIVARLRLRPFFLAQHQRGHGLGGEALSTEWPPGPWARCGPSARA